MNHICVLGLGYVGLPTAVLLSSHGFHVTGIDTDPHVLEKIKLNQVSPVEPNLLKLIVRAKMTGNLVLSPHAIPADVFIICVPTPFTKNHQADLHYVISAVNSLRPVLKKGNLVILESTVPPGTSKNLVKPQLEKFGWKIPKDIYLAYSPERVLPGKIFEELINNDRVIGGIDRKSALKTKTIFSSFVRGRIFLTDTTTAEIVKLVENSYRDVNIAFANEISKICDRLWLNSEDVIRLANSHPRVKILKPGTGVGGHCIAVDPWFLIEKAPGESVLTLSARKINDSMPRYFVAKVTRILRSKKIENPIIACLGITYKPDTDDCRESPALKIVNLLRRKKYTVRVCDPNIRNRVSGINLLPLSKVLKGTDLILLLVDHKQFKNLTAKKIKQIAPRAIVFNAQGRMK